MKPQSTPNSGSKRVSSWSSCVCGKNLTSATALRTSAATAFMTYPPSRYKRTSSPCPHCGKQIGHPTTDSCQELSSYDARRRFGRGFSSSRRIRLRRSVAYKVYETTLRACSRRLSGYRKLLHNQGINACESPVE